MEKKRNIISFFYTYIVKFTTCEIETNKKLKNKNVQLVT